MISCNSYMKKNKVIRSLVWLMSIKHRNGLTAATTLIFAALFLSCHLVTADGELQFNRDVRPILSEHCFHCHGPDSNHRESNLRLDTAAGAFASDSSNSDLAPDSGVPAIVPAMVDDSELMIRVLSDDPDFQMPPTGHGRRTLNTEEIETLGKWIEQGATYQDHWSFVTPDIPNLPTVKNNSWIRNPIDLFVLAQLESNGLKPNAEATRQQLIRRLTLDLTGLPPTIAEVDAFLADERPEAYEELVDRLLKSTHFGERMAVPWLDAARYADTNGFSIDDHRDMWLWREWVIDAFNANMPYDKFITNQLAGDLIPGATAQDRLATGFLRNSMNTHEGGTIAEEYRVIYIADKIDTVSTVFMGLTMRCAQCHEHKYDPISQQDYYRFFAFFDTAHEPGSGAVNGNTAPVERMDGLITDELTFKADVENRIATLQRYLIHPPELIQARAEWESTVGAAASDEFAEAVSTPVGDRTDAHWNTINSAFAKTSRLWVRHISTIKREIDVLNKDLQAGKASVMVMKERGPKPTYLLTRGQYDQPDRSQTLDPGIPSVLPPLQLKRNDSKASTDVKPELTIPAIVPWETARWIWDNALAARNPQDDSPRYFRLVIDLPDKPRNAILRATADNQCTTFLNGKSLGKNDPWMSPAEYDVTRMMNKGRNVIAIEAVNAGGPAGLLASLVVDGSTEFGTDKRWKVSQQSNSGWTDPEFDDQDWAAASELGPSSMAPWRIGPGASQTKADPNRPSRLTLAKWLTRDDHPLTARVAVNRFWQTLFGRGIVSTPNDFGSQGAFPTHPALLDWLAVQFKEKAWDTKQLIKLIVMSATYRQSSNVARSLIERDPHNALLARSPRYRLTAEFIRDGALAISGALDRRIGGPSVYPSQPHGLWREISHFGYGNAFSAQAFYPSDTRGQFRRSMYTFWKRTSPPPTMIAFDAPTREVCAVERSRTNTPLQALVLLNDPEYVQAARELAKLAMGEFDETEQRIGFMFRRATSRRPDRWELEVLLKRFEQARTKYQRDEQSAKALSQQLSAEHAAYTVVASVVLNLDEVITRE